MGYNFVKYLAMGKSAIATKLDALEDAHTHLTIERNELRAENEKLKYKNKVLYNHSTEEFIAQMLERDQELKNLQQKTEAQQKLRDAEYSKILNLSRLLMVFVLEIRSIFKMRKMFLRAAKILLSKNQYKGIGIFFERLEAVVTSIETANKDLQSELSDSTKNRLKREARRRSAST